jgi:valyl-tRNA synthetase
MGHVLNNTIQDVLARKAHGWQGSARLPGTDHAGIATENVVSQQPQRGEDQTLTSVARVPQARWAWKEKHGGIIIDQLKLGCSATGVASASMDQNACAA